MKKLIGILFLFVYSLSSAQDKYVIFLKDKNDSPFSVSRPDEFLSQRAIDRRNIQGIAVTEEDLPVNPAYLDSIKHAGALVIARSKWLNTVTVASDTASMIAIGQLSFVQSYKKVFGSNLDKSGTKIDKFKQDRSAQKAAFDPSDYGPAYNHISLLNGKTLHDRGLTGRKISIAVIDDGFLGADTHPVFDSLRKYDRIRGTWDVVNNTEFVYGFDSHGTSVLSLMAGFIPGQYIGTAPEADYWLIRTEDADTEYIIEEYNWVSGAEIADSAGVDVINTSLGYTQFDAASQNHTYADMDGLTTVISIGADIAFSKGMLVVVAAGNSGNDNWHYISAPADARGVLAVGATFSDGSLATFSSRGPSADQRVKPNVAGQGAICYVAEPGGSFGYGSGTSYASPIMAGMSACLWSARKSITNQELKELIESVSSQYTDPDDDRGYGIPNFEEAYLKLTNSGFGTQKTNSTRIYPNPFNEALRFDFKSGSDTNLDIELRDQLGRIVLSKRSTVLPHQLNQVEWNGLENLAKGMYLVRIGNNDSQVTGKVIKQ